MDQVIESRAVAQRVRACYRKRCGYTSNRGLDMIGRGVAFPNKEREERRRAAWIRTGLIAMCRFCGAVREGTIDFALRHHRECPGASR